MNTEIKNAVAATDDKAQYDEYAKRLLAQKDVLLEPYDWEGNIDLLNIVLIGITNELPKHDKRYELHRLITALLSDKLETSPKYDILENEYNILLNDDLRKDVNVMCNLGQGIEDRATERATEKANEKVVWNMYQEGYTLVY